MVLDDENKKPKQILSIDVPKLIDQHDITMPSKDELIASDLPVNEVIKAKFLDENTYRRNQDQNINGLFVDPTKIEIEINNDDTISIVTKDSNPKTNFRANYCW